jgi:hypothetical protein
MECACFLVDSRNLSPHHVRQHHCPEVFRSQPKSQAIVAEVFEEAGFPPGVLNFISISREAAPALTAEIIGNPHVRTINVCSGSILQMLCQLN